MRCLGQHCCRSSCSHLPHSRMQTPTTYGHLSLILCLFSFFLNSILKRNCRQTSAVFKLGYKADMLTIRTPPLPRTGTFCYEKIHFWVSFQSNVFQSTSIALLTQTQCPHCLIVLTINKEFNLHAKFAVFKLLQLEVLVKQDPIPQEKIFKCSRFKIYF